MTNAATCAAPHNPTTRPSKLDRLSPVGCDKEAKLVVMGGYGHTRTYELVRGGVIRTMPESMTVPVLMSH